MKTSDCGSVMVPLCGRGLKTTLHCERRARNFDVVPRCVSQHALVHMWLHESPVLIDPYTVMTPVQIAVRTEAMEHSLMRVREPAYRPIFG